MTIKTISGTYSAGYLLNSKYSTVDVTSSGSIGGFGLIVQAATVDNSGRLSATNGSDALYMTGVGVVNNASGGVILGGAARSGYTTNGAGYAGGDAIHALAYVSIANSGVLYGGQGGVGAYDGAGEGVVKIGGAGGAGGAGVQLKTGGALVNHELVQGGFGGRGGDAGYAGGAYGYGGRGGQGAAGVVAGSGGRIVNAAGEIYGGGGGVGGIGYGVRGLVGGEGGGGGTGGDGVALNNVGYVYVEAGRIQGGAGGAGGYGPNGNGIGGRGGVGVYLKAGGLVSVSAGAAIDGGGGGAGAYSPNQGGTGVYLRAGGTVSNRGVIAGGGSGFYGGYGVELAGAGEVFNYGSITGGGIAMGVLLKNGGTVTNDGSIATGVAIYAGGKVFNNGSIGKGFLLESSTFEVFGGVLIESNGVVVNGGAKDTTASIVSTGSRPGYYGVDVTGSGSTITNFGTISGSTAAVKFGGANNTLIVEAGCVFTGAVLGGGGTLELANGKGDLSAFNAGGDITVSGSMATTTFQNFGTLEIGKKAKFSLTGGGTVGAGQSLIDAGTLLVGNTLTVDGSLTVSRTLGSTSRKHPSTLAIEGGTAAFDAGAVLDVTNVKVDEAATVNVATNLSAGSWSQSAGTLNVSSGDTLTFFPATDSFAGTFSGGGTVAFAGGAASFNGLTLAAGTVSATGAVLTLGSTGLTLASSSTLTLDSASTITAASAGDTLSNGGVILGAGTLGGGQMTLVNASGGLIEASSTALLTIDTGVAFITNDGLIASANTGGLTIQSAIANAGQFYVAGGTLTLNGAVSGSGQAIVNVGTLVANATFTQAVSFNGTTGELVLANSRSYTGTITGFSKGGGTVLDLRDVGFLKSTEAKFSGTSSGGTLTVKDGAEVATIALSGDYLSSNFVCSSDGSGGVLVQILTNAAAAPPPPHALIAAMATLGAGSAAIATHAAEPWREHATSLAAPHRAIA